MSQFYDCNWRVQSRHWRLISFTELNPERKITAPHPPPGIEKSILQWSLLLWSHRFDDSQFKKTNPGSNGQGFFFNPCFLTRVTGHCTLISVSVNSNRLATSQKKLCWPCLLRPWVPPSTAVGAPAWQINPMTRGMMDGLMDRCSCWQNSCSSATTRTSIVGEGSQKLVSLKSRWKRWWWRQLNQN